mgnify:CR=1 FL=1
MELKLEKERAGAAARWSFNRTFMELKRTRLLRLPVVRCVLIAPLWN